MRTWVAPVVYAACIILAGDSHAGRFPDNLRNCLNRITAHIYNDRFEHAEILIDSLWTHDGPPGFCHFFRAVVYQARMMAAESDFLEKEFFAALDSVETDARAMLARGGDSALAQCFLGHSHSFRALYFGRAGSILKALKHGFKAGRAYGTGYDIDSTFHDIALGLGSYRYWKSVKTRLVNWTPLFKNERQNGIDLLHLAIDSSEISADPARVSLIWVYINEKRYPEAIRLADEMQHRHPEGMIFQWALGIAHFKNSDFSSAARIYRTILDRLAVDPGNYYNVIEAAYYLSRCWRELNDGSPEAAGELMMLQRQVRGYPLPEKTRKRQKKKIKDILKALD